VAKALLVADRVQEGHGLVVTAVVEEGIQLGLIDAAISAAVCIRDDLEVAGVAEHLLVYQALHELVRVRLLAAAAGGVHSACEVGREKSAFKKYRKSSNRQLLISIRIASACTAKEPKKVSS
jgi:hypothetical protein